MCRLARVDASGLALVHPLESARHYFFAALLVFAAERVAGGHDRAEEIREEFERLAERHFGIEGVKEVERRREASRLSPVIPFRMEHRV